MTPEHNYYDSLPAELLDEGKIGVFRIDFQANQITMSGRSCLQSLLGTDEMTATVDWDFFLNQLCHPQDSAGVREVVERARIELGAANKEYRVYNAVHNDWRWACAFGKVYCKEDGSPDYLLGGFQNINDGVLLQQTLAKMNEADERLKVMLNATPMCCLLFDQNCRPIDCNQEAQKLFGVEDKQYLLDHIEDFSPEFQPNGRTSNEMSSDIMRLAFETGQSRAEWLHLTMDGELMPAEKILTRIKWKDTYVVASYTWDLREHRRSLAAVREADELTQIMFDAMPLCCNFWDEHHNNIYCNQEAAKLFELKDTQEYLDRFFDLSPEYQPCGRLSKDMADENIEKAFATGGVVFEWMHQKLNGEPMPSEITLVRVKRKNAYNVVGYTHDLREIKKTLSEMHEAERKMRIARDQAEESARAKSEFLANMSHEIRTPMNAILGMTHLTLKSEITPKQRFYLEKVEQSGKSLLRIINDILDFSKIEAGKLDMEMTVFTLESVLGDIADVILEQVSGKKISISIHLDPDLPSHLLGDPLRLNQVLVNLMGNAAKFTSSGSITLSVSREASLDNKHTLQFCVRDTGIGMSQMQVDALFTPFAQADTSTTRKYGGTGLGLAICKSLVAMMGGRIWCESAKGEGTAFHFTAVFDQPAELQSAVTETIASLHVHLIGDNEPALDAIRVMLQLLRCTTTKQILPLDAFQSDMVSDELLKAQLVILQGIHWTQQQTAAQTLKARFGSGMPPLLLTAQVHEIEHIRQSNAHQAFPLLPVPTTLSSLFDTVVSIIGQQELRRDRHEEILPVASMVPEDIRGARILLAEDNEINQILATELLTMEGFVVDVAKNGREALALLDKSIYDLVLMDIQMPEMDGLEATTEIRKHARFKELPILAMTAHAMTRDRELSLQVGMNDHVTKPIDPELLYEALKKWIKPQSNR